MKRWIASIVLITLITAAHTVAVVAQERADEEQQALRARIEERYDIVPLSDGVALTPKTRRSDLRLIEVSDTIAVNGTVVTGRELRERVGEDADAILRLSYLDPAARRALVAARADRPTTSDPPAERTPQNA